MCVCVCVFMCVCMYVCVCFYVYVYVYVYMYMCVCVWFISYYQVVLQSLFRVSKTRSYGRIRDNICAAVCRMIVAGKESMPLNEVLL